MLWAAHSDNTSTIAVSHIWFMREHPDGPDAIAIFIADAGRRRRSPSTQESPYGVMPKAKAGSHSLARHPLRMAEALGSGQQRMEAVPHPAE